MDRLGVMITLTCNTGNEWLESFEFKMSKNCKDRVLELFV